MTAQLAPTPIQKFFDNNGNPLFNGKLYSYVAGTSTPQATYTDSTMGTQNTNPVILNARGEANVWLDTILSYKLVLQDANGTQIWVVDNIPGNGVFGTVQNIAALRNVTGVGVSNYQAIIMDGYTTAGDGGGGTFWWNSTSTVADNGGTIIAPTGISTGRWYRILTNYITPQMFGAVGNGTNDDSTAFSNAALLCGTYVLFIPYTSGGYLINTPFVLPNNPMMVGDNYPLLFTTVAGNHICSGTNLTGKVYISGIRFLGANSSTVPTYGFPSGVFSPNNTGLLAIANCSDVRILDCGASTFYNGISANGCTRVWIQRNKVDTFIYTGVLVSSTTAFEIEFNDISNCTQSGASVSYGVQFTGNSSGGSPEQYNSISFNRINGIPSWYAIESHDVDGIRVIGNDIRNVRSGISIGHLVSTNICKNIIISNNYIEQTTTDTWSGSSAEIAGIVSEGYSATARVSGVVISDNLIRNFFNVVGMVGGGNSGCINVTHTDDVCVSGNVITGAGAGNIPQCGGVFVFGTCYRLSINGNSFQGTLNRGGIELSSVISDAVTITGNSGIQTNTSNNHIIIVGCTIPSAQISNNPSNSTAPYYQSTSTLALNTLGTTAPTITSGTVYQNTYIQPITLYIPVTYNPTSGAAATCAVALGPTSTPATIHTISKPAGLTTLDGDINVETLVVPGNWYYSLTVTNATIGTPTLVQGN